MSLSLWRFFLEELLTLWRRKSQPVDIQVAVPMPVLGLCDTLRKGSQKSRQQALLGSERQSSSTDASQSPCPCGLHWVPMFRFPSLVRKTVSHPRITHMVGRTNRKGFLRSWNWGGQVCNSECCTEAFVGGSYAELIYGHAVPTLCAPAWLQLRTWPCY